MGRVGRSRDREIERSRGFPDVHVFGVWHFRRSPALQHPNSHGTKSQIPPDIVILEPEWSNATKILDEGFPVVE